MDLNQRLTTFYIVRHGETDWNVHGILQGQTDVELNSSGLKQAEVLARNLNGLNFDAIFSSDLLRAKRTAEIIALQKRLMVTTSTALRERRFGKYEGKKFEEFKNEFKEVFLKFQELSKEERYKFRYSPEVETDGEVVSRFLTFLRELATSQIGKTLLIVSHSGPMKHLLVHLGFVENVNIISIKNTGYIKLSCDGVEFFIEEVKDVENKLSKSI